jgi:hypothetical protein
MDDNESLKHVHKVNKATAKAKRGQRNKQKLPIFSNLSGKA